MAQSSSKLHEREGAALDLGDGGSIVTKDVVFVGHIHRCVQDRVAGIPD